MRRDGRTAKRERGGFLPFLIAGVMTAYALILLFLITGDVVRTSQVLAAAAK